MLEFHTPAIDAANPPPLSFTPATAITAIESHAPAIDAANSPTTLESHAPAIDTNTPPALTRLHTLLTTTLAPLLAAPENLPLFDHRRHLARPSWSHPGLLSPTWSTLLSTITAHANAAGLYRLALDGTSATELAAVREELGATGWGAEVAAAVVGAEAGAHERRRAMGHAAAALGSAVYCINACEGLGKQRALAAKADLLRELIRIAAHEMDGGVDVRLDEKVAMCDYFATGLCVEAAELAMRVHGGMERSGRWAFEDMWREYRGYRTGGGRREGDMREVAVKLFRFGGSGEKEFKL